MRAPLIDSHVHFWDPGELPYPWLEDLPAIASRHLPDRLVAEAELDPSARLVFVQAAGDPDRWLDEVRWVDSLARTEPRIVAIVAYAAMDAGARLPGTLAELKKHPLVRGIRHVIQGERDPQFCARAQFVAGVQSLGPRNLTFDLCCRHHQLPAVVELVRRCPQTSFILDHAGKPDIARSELEPWREHIAVLATLPNVVCKLSGLITEANLEAWTDADLQPYVNHLLAKFGPARLLFGSDWPVVKLAGSYRRWLDTVETLLSALSPNERHAIFHDNAARVYRLS